MEVVHKSLVKQLIYFSILKSWYSMCELFCQYATDMTISVSTIHNYFRGLSFYMRLVLFLIHKHLDSVQFKFFAIYLKHLCVHVHLHYCVRSKRKALVCHEYYNYYCIIGFVTCTCTCVMFIIIIILYVCTCTSTCI